MRLLAALLVSVALSATACADDGTTGSCAEIREPEDPRSIQHVIDAESVVFQTDPPTSGPHLSGPPLQGLFGQPIAPAAQVRTLESGGIVVQYESEGALEAMRTLLDDEGDAPIAVAPNTDLPAAVVATAWTWKLTCDSPNIARIREFAASRTVDAPGLN